MKVSHHINSDPLRPVREQERSSSRSIGPRSPFDGILKRLAAEENSAQASSAAPAPAAAAPPADPRPTAESVFGANPWVSAPFGFSAYLGAYSYNPQYFATKETADKVAQMLGGTVVTKNAMVGDGGPFFQSQPNYMVELPNGHLINPGLTATYFTHGWSQSLIDVMLGYDRNA